MTITLEAPAQDIDYGTRAEARAENWATVLRNAGYTVKIEKSFHEGLRSSFDGELLTRSTVHVVLSMTHRSGTLVASWISVTDGGRRTTSQLAAYDWETGRERKLRTPRELAAKINSLVAGR